MLYVLWRWILLSTNDLSTSKSQRQRAHTATRRLGEGNPVGVTCVQLGQVSYRVCLWPRSVTAACQCHLPLPEPHLHVPAPAPQAPPPRPALSAAPGGRLRQGAPSRGGARSSRRPAPPRLRVSGVLAAAVRARAADMQRWGRVSCALARVRRRQGRHCRGAGGGAEARRAWEFGPGALHTPPSAGSGREGGRSRSRRPRAAAGLGCGSRPSPLSLPSQGTGAAPGPALPRPGCGDPGPRCGRAAGGRCVGSGPGPCCR